MQKQPQVSDGLANMENTDKENKKLSSQQIVQLLQLYAAHRCLWDVWAPDHLMRLERRAALIDIATAMGNELSPERVLRKINTLRATYRYEKRRIKQRIRRGIGATTKLQWFPVADAFLRHVTGKRVRKAGQPASTPEACSDSDLEDIVVSICNSETLILAPVHIKSPSSQSDVAKDTVKNTETVMGQKAFVSEETSANMSFESIKCDDRSPECLGVASAKFWHSRKGAEFLAVLIDYPVIWDGLRSTKLNKQLHVMHAIAKRTKQSLQRVQKRVAFFRYQYRKEVSKRAGNLHKASDGTLWPEEVNYTNSKKDETSASIEEDNAQLAVKSIDRHETFDNNDFTHIAATSTCKLKPCKSLITPSVTSCCRDNKNYKTPVDNESELSDQGDLEKSTRATSVRHPSKIVIWNGLEDNLLEGKWSLQHSVKFLRLYAAHRSLWDLNDHDYRSRALRDAAFIDIAAAMGHGLTASYVAKKIKIFRITYMQQRKRMLEAIKQGKSPEIRLRWFPLADSFLRPHIGLRCIKEQECEMPQFDYQYVYANLNLIDPTLLTDFRGKGTQNVIEIGNEGAQGHANGKKNSVGNQLVDTDKQTALTDQML